jgi:alpha-tubulin suppressor-like RCC1 family protein
VVRSRSVWLLYLLACSPATDPQVVVVLDAEPGTLARATWLSVVVTDSTGAVAAERTLAIGGATPDVAFPARIPLTARGADPSRSFELVASLFDGAMPVDPPFSIVRVAGGYVEDRVLELPVFFTDRCADRPDCGAGRTCWYGTCRGACFEATGGPAAPRCTECERCVGARTCAPLADGEPCGCEESCASGACVSETAIQIVAAGAGHTCARDAHDVYCWGRNTDGELGVGGRTASAVPVLVDTGSIGAAGGTIDAGGVMRGFTCAVDYDTGALACWGANSDGQLGAGDTTTRETPVEIAGTLFQSVALGGSHSCGLDTTGELWCWGRNAGGRLGIDRMVTEERSPQHVTPGRRWSDVCAGQHQTCAIDAADRSLHCWGQNVGGVLGLGSDMVDKYAPAPLRFPGSEVPWSEIACGAYHTCALRSDGQVWCWGGNAHGQVGRGRTADVSDPAPIASELPFRHLDCGGSYCCAITTEGALYCWGENTSGQIGIGTTVDPQPAPVLVAPGTEWSELGLGDSHACATQTDASTWCWGQGADGRLGLGDTEPRTVPARVCF